jgi:hypothetical protein
VRRAPVLDGLERLAFVFDERQVDLAGRNDAYLRDLYDRTRRARGVLDDIARADRGLILVAVEPGGRRLRAGEDRVDQSLP